jgi:integrase
MQKVRFYLKKVPKKRESLIVLKFSYAGRRLVYSFGESVPAAAWSTKNQRVKNNSHTAKTKRYELNRTLDKLQDGLQEAYTKELVNGVPEPEKLKQYLHKIMHPSEPDDNFLALFDRFISGEITFRGKAKKEQTLKNYATTKKHLTDFSDKKNYALSFESINLDFYHKFTTYVREVKNLKQNTIAKDITNIKAVMNTANSFGYTSNQIFKNRDFAAQEEEVETVHLSERELMKLYKHDFSKNKKLECVRDLFVFACFIGQRFSDFTKVHPNNIVDIDGEKFIRMKTQKSGEIVTIPCNNVVLEIFEKYRHNPNSLPNPISSQKFNEYVKDACKAAKLNEKGRLSSDPEKELWQLCSSHTARRSFATNLYLEGFPTYDLMKITGHRTEKSFQKYIKISKLDAAKKLAAHNKKKNWSAIMMKAVS